MKPTIGTKITAKARAKGNKMTAEERSRLLKIGLRMIKLREKRLKLRPQK